MLYDIRANSCFLSLKQNKFLSYIVTCTFRLLYSSRADVVNYNNLIAINRSVKTTS
jgi:hypothetical protein